MMFDENVVFPEDREVPRNSMANFLCVPVLGQPIMVRKYLNLVLCPKQEVPPIFQSSHQGQEFLVIDVIVPLGRDKGLGVVSYWLEC
jgi:hypothetical protein